MPATRALRRAAFRDPIPERAAIKSCLKLDRPADHQFLDLADRLGRIQALRTDVDAVHDGVATEQAVRVFQVVQAAAGGFVAAVRDEAVGLQQAGRADELVRIPPERRAGSGTARAQDALVQTVQLFAGLGRLQAFLSGGGVSLMRYGRIEWYWLKKCVMSTIRSRITGRPGSGRSTIGSFSSRRFVVQARPFLPLMFMASEPHTLHGTSGAAPGCRRRRS